MPEPTQEAFPFWCDEAKLKEFLTRVLAIEAEHDRLREELQALKDAYANFIPLRGVMAAVKIVHTQEKLINHPKEPMERAHLAVLVAHVQRHMLGLDVVLEALTRLESGTRVCVDIHTREVRDA